MTAPDPAGTAGPGLATEFVGTGRPIGLLHGFTQTGRSWGRFGELLASHRQLCCVDLPGHGAAAEVRWGLDRTADELAGRGPMDWLGYSLGGRHALTLAVRHPTAVRSLVLIGATPGLETDEERVERRAADAELARKIRRIGVEAFLDEWLRGPLFAGLPDDAAGRSERLRNTVDGLAASLELAGTGAQIPVWDRLADLAMPVLLVTGSLDTKFTDIARRMAELVPDVRHVVIADAGHAAHLERPEAVAESVLEFLARPRT
ncbi:MAG: alpha/beta fold hydrolase [Ilumatobacteraceae bacterium]